MVQINFAQKSVTVKIVYYGPGMSGKTTNLEVVHQRAPDNSRGELTSISTDGDRTLFFDFMPLDLGTVAGMRTQFQIYTVPGQVYYNSTRKLVLQGVDGVIFVADSSASMVDENLESLRDLQENLAEYGKDMAAMPMAIQYNKRDLPDALPTEELERLLNPRGLPSFEAVANTGQGVFPTLKAIAALVLDTIHQQAGGGAGGPAPAVPADSETPVAQQPAPAATPGPVAPPVQSTGTGFYPASQVPTPPAAQAPEPQAQPSPAPPVPPAPAPSIAPGSTAPPVVEPSVPDHALAAQAPEMPLAQEPPPAAAPAPAPEMAQPIPMAGGEGEQQPAGIPTGFPQPTGAPQGIGTPEVLSKTDVHPPPQLPPTPSAGVGSPVQPPPAQPQAAPEAQGAAQGLRLVQPVAPPETLDAPQGGVMGAPQQAATAPPAGSLMQVPQNAAPPPAEAPASRAVPSPQAPRIKPRSAALATPSNATNRKSAIMTVVFVVVALAVGIGIGGLMFDLL